MRGEAIHDEQPPPTGKAISPVKGEAPRCNQTTERTSKHLEHEEGGKSLAELVLSVPSAEEIDDAREEDGLGDTQEDTEGEEGLVVWGGGRAGADGAPDGGCAADVCGCRRGQVVREVEKASEV